MFTKESTVRLSEVGSDGYLTLPGVINYFQDCSELHSESVGVGVEVDNDYAWVLNSWQIQIKSYPKMNDKITVGTLPHRIKGIQGDRNFLMMDENDNVIINANSIWSYFDFINNI
jgi:acyl-ACP thioesterase